MNKTYIIIALYLLPSILSKGVSSIFDEIPNPLITPGDPSDDQQSTPQSPISGGPLPNSSPAIITGQELVTPTFKPIADAEKTRIPLGDFVQPSTQPQNLNTSPAPQPEDPSVGLLEQNTQLQNDISSLEQQLFETLSNLNSYRVQEASDLEKYLNQVQGLNEYYGVLISEPNSEIGAKEEPKKKTMAEKMKEKEEDEDDDDDDDEDDELEASFTIIGVIGLGFLFLLLHNIKGLWAAYIGAELSQAIYSLLIDTTILVMIWCILAVIENFDVTDLEIDTIFVGLSLFASFWLMQGFWLIFLSYIKSQNWKRLERMILFPNDFTPEVTEFISMRQAFIFPIYTASVTESQLHPSFQFSSYLSRSLGQTVYNGYHITWIGYIFIIVSIITWRVLSTSGYSLEIYAIWSLPAGIFLICLILLVKLRLIYRALVPKSLKKEIKLSSFKHLTNDEARSGFYKPDYLRGKIEEGLTTSCICCKVNPFQMTCAYLFLSRYPNRHELLFWFDSYGPIFLSVLLQALSVLHTFWITGVFLFYIPIFIDEVDDYGVYLLVLAILVWVITGFYLLPKLFVYLCLTSKLELMKDRKVINDVIDEQRKESILRTVRIYRQLKMIYREIKGRREGEEKSQLLHFMKKITEEVFLLVADGRKEIHITEIDEVLNLIGVRLSEDELRLFAKECSPDKENFIEFKGLRIAIERILYGYELNPAEVVKYILGEHFGKKQKLDVSDLNEFFNEWSWHFSEDNLREFIIEVQSLADESGNFKHEEVANMVRINIEGYPK